jgi:hypothetical protein
LRLPTAAAVRLHLADSSYLVSFVIDKSDQIASARSIFFGWFPTNLQLAIRLQAVFLRQLPASWIQRSGKGYLGKPKFSHRRNKVVVRQHGNVIKSQEETDGSNHAQQQAKGD